MNPEVETMILDNSKAVGDVERHLAKSLANIRGDMGKARNNLQALQSQLARATEIHTRMIGAHDHAHGELARLVEQRLKQANEGDKPQQQQAKKRRGRQGKKA